MAGQGKEVKQQEEDGIANMIFRLLPLLMLVGFFGAGYMYYKDTQARIEQLRENNAKLEVATEANREAFEILQQENAANQVKMAELQSELQQAEVYQDELIGKLRRHNLTVLTLQKPGLIENRVNNASEKLREELQGITSNP